MPVPATAGAGSGVLRHRSTVRVAALYDVHGNLPALEAVLGEPDVAAADVVVFGGDLVAGPFPCEALERARALGGRARFIRGNAERGLGEDAWVAAQLAGADAAELRGWPFSVELELEPLGGVLFCHASPRSDEEILTPRSPAARLDGALAGVAAALVVVGHTHVQFELEVAGVRLVNAGSVGMPYADAPGAYWALLGGRGGLELRRTAYDFDAAARAIARSDWPHAAEFAAENVRRVPTAEEALALFERQAAGG